MCSNETNMTEVSEGDREKLNIISKLLNTDLTQESILPEVKLKCFAGYAMYLADLARHSDGHVVFRPPHHFTYDVHTTQQIYKIFKDTYLIKFEDIQQYADRCGFHLPHLHPTPGPLTQCKDELIYWLKDNPDFKKALKLHLRFDYQLRAKCQSVQSLPANLFTK